jgi:hypothetical protein
MSDTELFYVRYIFVKNSRNPCSARGVILHHLWEMYGFDLSRPAGQLVRYSAMATLIVCLAGRHASHLPREYYEYMAQFHKGLRKAVRENLVDESHLLSLFLITECTTFLPQPDANEYQTYVGVFCAVLENLILRCPYPRRKPIWTFVLCSLRRHHWLLWPVNDASDAQANSLQLLDRQLPGYEDGSKEVLFKSTSHPCRQFDRTQGLCHLNTMDVRISIETRFRLTYRHRVVNGTTIEDEDDFRKFLHDVCTCTNGFEKYKYLDEIFEVISPKLKLLI